jgi:hypothetical protein
MLPTSRGNLPAKVSICCGRATVSRCGQRTTSASAARAPDVPDLELRSEAANGAKRGVGFW